MTQNLRQDKFIEVHGIRLHYLTEGEGPLVILLHGFPESSYTWRHQMGPLADHFKVVAFDLIGYGKSDKPKGLKNYFCTAISKEMSEVIKGLGYEKAHIVGHDWGGIIAWITAMYHPSVVDKLVILNGPHPYLYKKALLHSIPQIKKSWYVFLFWIPFLPEWFFKRNIEKIVHGVFKNVIRKKKITLDDLNLYIENLKTPGSIKAILNYYKAGFLSFFVYFQNFKIKTKAPTLVIWGEDDAALDISQVKDLEKQVEAFYQLKKIPNCTHFVNEEQPEVVNQLILDFLTKSS